MATIKKEWAVKNETFILLDPMPVNSLSKRKINFLRKSEKK